MIVYVIIMLVAAVQMLGFGIAIFRGNASLIHDYHRKNIEKGDAKRYARAFSVGLFIIAAAFFASGLAALIIGERAGIATILLPIIGLAAGITVIVLVQKKYNGGVF
ncbi:MAG: DUF3784 domain-containing protein [Clostridia bacterium]|nr:DUF3784 domain-containing protein [Clostridia bacterium]